MIGALKDGRGNKTRPDNCVGCGIPLLTRKRFAKPPAGYDWHQGHGKCGKCYSQSRKRTLTVTQCLDCGRPLRLHTELASEKPGTLKHSGRGLCNTDYERRRRAGTLDRIGTLTPTTAVVMDDEAVARKTEHDRRELVAYIRARRARGWPADGTLPAIEGL
jgi:hypothetical protein